MGYLPEAMVNYLARLGWSFGDQEIFTLKELIEKFSFENVQKSSAIFNPDKLLWVNAHHIRHGDPKRIAELLVPFLNRTGFEDSAKAMPSGWLERLVIALRERSRTLVEMAQAAALYLAEAVTIEPGAAEKFLTPTVIPALEKLMAQLQAAPDFTKATLEGIFHRLLDEHGLKMGQLAQPVRVALTGRTATPGIFEVLDLLGRDKSVARLRQAIEQAKPARA
jgi:glutamyl-tRNA synthetase